MKNDKSTRREFIAASALTGATGLLSASLLANDDNKSGNKLNLAEGPLSFLFQGDSITDGSRGRNADPNHIMGHGYAFAVAGRVGADFPASGFTFYNRGVSGNTIVDLQKRWQTDTLDIKPDLLSVLIGINDTAAVIEERPDARSAEDFENDYRQLLNNVKSEKPDTIFVLGIPFVYAVGKRKENYEQWKVGALQRADRIKKLAKEFNAVLVDYPAVFEKAIAKAPVEYWIWDGIHPTVPAHELMAREWIKQAATRLPFLKHYHY